MRRRSARELGGGREDESTRRRISFCRAKRGAGRGSCMPVAEMTSRVGFLRWRARVCRDPERAVGCWSDLACCRRGLGERQLLAGLVVVVSDGGGWAGRQLSRWRGVKCRRWDRGLSFWGLWSARRCVRVSAWGAFQGRTAIWWCRSADRIGWLRRDRAARLMSGDVVLVAPARPNVSAMGARLRSRSGLHSSGDRGGRKLLVVSVGSPSRRWPGAGWRYGRRPCGDGGGTWCVGRNGLVGVSLTGAGRGRAACQRAGGRCGLESSRGLLWRGPGRLDLGRATGPRKTPPAGARGFAVVSPDGSRVALVRGGSVWIVRVRDGAGRRLITGAAPAWSPVVAGSAYLGPGGAVEIVGAGGGRPRHTSALSTARGLSWQPLPASARRSCSRPPGSTVLASDRQAVVFSHPSLVVYGCLKAVGIRRVLFDARNCYCGPVMAVRLAGRFAALESENGKPPAVFESDSLYDLGNGRSTHLATAAVQTDTEIRSTLSTP